MKKILTNVSALFACLVFSALAFQSCSPSNDVQPLHLMPNTISVKVADMDAQTTQEQPKHLLITSTSGANAVILDTMINGNFTYSFVSSQSSLSIKATLTSTTPFICSLEIDRNNKLDAYNHGSCNNTEFDISDQLSF